MKEPHLQTKLKNESMTWQQKKDFGNPPVSEGLGDFSYQPHRF
jgi:hypothetical protein